MSFFVSDRVRTTGRILSMPAAFLSTLWSTSVVLRPLGHARSSRFRRSVIERLALWAGRPKCLPDGDCTWLALTSSLPIVVALFDRSPQRSVSFCSINWEQPSFLRSRQEQVGMTQHAAVRSRANHLLLSFFFFFLICGAVSVAYRLLEFGRCLAGNLRLLLVGSISKFK